MNKTALVLALAITVIFSMVAGVQLSSLARANIMIGFVRPNITILSPFDGTYNTNNLSLIVNFTAITTGLYDGGPRYENTRLFTYTLDEKESHNITVTRQYIGRNPGSDVFFEGEESLNDLNEGLHNLTVRGVFLYSYYTHPDLYNITAESESTVFFRVDTVPQNITILEPENTTYTPSEVPLLCFIDEPASWIGYSLDGQENITVTGNVTLPDVSLGQHNLTVFASDAFGNYANSKTINFNVIAPFPTLLVATASVIIIIVVFAVFLLMRKNKHRSLRSG